jgi:carbon-monoxide dehydrogenase small subunit
VDAEIALTVNGAPVRFVGDPLTRLLDVLRRQLGLTGAKEGCGEGECGACTVWLDGEAVCACLVPMLQLEGRDVRTIEGLAPGRMTALQTAFVEEGAVQCGACTPGMIMSAEALLVRRPRPSGLEIRTHLAGNVCRCTGYQAIVRAVQRAAATKGKAVRGGRGSKPSPRSRRSRP